jgi:nucleosome binding factor SPN SPT16 subunit
MDHKYVNIKNQKHIVKNVEDQHIVNMKRLNLCVKNVVDHSFVFILNKKLIAKIAMDLRFVNIKNIKNYVLNVADQNYVKHHYVKLEKSKNMMGIAFDVL